MKTDYPELEGIIVTHHFTDGNTIKIKIIGCSYYIGITGVSVDNPNNKILCLNAKLHRGHYYTKLQYMRTFRNTVKEIKAGHLYPGTMYKILEVSTLDYNCRAINQNCAFI